LYYSNLLIQYPKFYIIFVIIKPHPVMIFSVTGFYIGDLSQKLVKAKLFTVLKSALCNSEK